MNLRNTTTLCYDHDRFSRLWTCEMGYSTKEANEKKLKLEKEGMFTESFYFDKNDKISIHAYDIRSDLSEKCMEASILDDKNYTSYNAKYYCNVDIKFVKKINN
jgi:hypothetical protein